MRKGSAAFPGAFAEIHDQGVSPHFLGQAVTHRVEPASGNRDRVDFSRCRKRRRRIYRIGIDMPINCRRIRLG